MIVAFVIAALATAQNPPRRVPIPADLAREAYELYSAIYAAPHTCDPFEPDEGIVVSSEAVAESRADVSIDDLHPRSADEQWMARNLIDRIKIPYVWDSKSNFGRRIRVLGEKEEEAVTSCLARRSANRKEDTECLPYAKVIYVRSFSVPSFNRDHTRALIFTNRSCGRIQCGGQEFSEYRKIGSRWIRQDGFGDCVFY